ncbi:hypothetical protein NDU88_001746 [Pleurodeles waltl]|uniref:Uncharacterized protein n=1 Tax=Pleurodeles waltl TaxID=8319 RepID=A0AAV7NDG4_PLEWA|nr:hypothetical protein NDU88_001746 [Pleurodeles waltl]
MRNQSWAKPGLVCFRGFALLCVGRVGAAGLQIGTGSVNQGGPHTREQRHLAPNSGRRWRMAQGDSPLPHPTKDNQRSSRAAPGVESPVVGIRGPLCIQHQRTDCASPRGAYPKRAPHRAAPGGPQSPRCMQSRSQEAPGSAPRAGGQIATAGAPPDAPIRSPPPSGWARVRIRCRAQHTAQSGISAAIRRRPRGYRPSPGRTSPLEAAPGAAAALKQPWAYQPLTFSAPTRGASQPSASRPRPSTGPRPLSSVPGSPSHSGARSRGRVRTSAVPPVRSSRPSPLWARDRPIQRVQAPI